MQLRRLQATDYDDLLGLLNPVFTRQNGFRMDFEKQLPKMCVRDDAHMGMHFGIFEDGKLVSCIGVYPLETVVAGQKLLFSTMGNIATHWDYTGRGYMSKLIDAAQQELERIGADASRLGGNRQRYGRYGFESCGQVMQFTFAKNTLASRFPSPGEISFVKIEKEDRQALAFCATLYNQNAIAVTREIEDCYPTMTAWEHVPYLCLSEGKPVGYLCANADGSNLAEIAAVDTRRFTDILCRWQKWKDTAVTFLLQPHMTEKIRQFSAICDAMQIRSPSHFQIRNWEGVISAFLKLKATYCTLPDGELMLEIKDYGTIRIFVNGNAVGCERTDKQPQLTLDRLQAARFLFGPLSPEYTAKVDNIPAGWFPLPLSWNGQDRV